jgi:hypothetical protein
MADIAQQIRERAHQIWEEQGRPDGLAVDHWCQAERELQSENEGEDSQAGAHGDRQTNSAVAQHDREAAELQEVEEAGKQRSRGKSVV